MTKSKDTCWICGGIANSHEHMVKASDIKSVFGLFNQQNPLLFHAPKVRPTKIYGKGDGRLVFKIPICSHCNNQRTQPHDYAWQGLSAHLQKMKSEGLIRLHKAFPGNVSASMLQAHLYFLKLFGCLIVEYKIPIPLASFRNAILRESAHPNVWISFGTGIKIANHKHVGHSQIAAHSQHGRIKFASWFYTVGDISANIIYAEPDQHRKGLTYAWHPNTVGKRIKMAAY